MPACALSWGAWGAVASSRWQACWTMTDSRTNETHRVRRIGRASRCGSIVAPPKTGASLKRCCLCRLCSFLLMWRPLDMARVLRRTCNVLPRGQLHQPRPGRNARLELHDPHRWLELEARLPRPAGVHHRHGPVHQLEHRLVGVSIHDDLGAREGFMQVGGSWMSELVAVRHHDREPVELELGDLRQARAKLRGIRVAVHRRNVRDRLELDEDLWLADVAGVEDVVDLLEHLEHFGAQETVRIRNHPESHSALVQRSVVASCNYLPSQRFTSAMSSPRWSSTRCTTKSTRSRTCCGL